MASRPAHRRASWRSWSGTVRCEPARIVTPTTEDEIVEAVRGAAEAGHCVRAAGTGHSFNQLACTDGVIVQLTRYSGVTRLDPAAGSVTIRAGTSLRSLHTELARAGLALANTGTIAEQTVAGAISTGNHGTGLAYPPFSGQVTGLRLVKADGSVRFCDAATEPELFHCARTALGTLGVVTELTLRVVPAFNLRVVPGSARLESLVERFEDWAAGADHVAASWLPWTDQVSTLAMHRTDAPATPRASLRPYRTTLDEVRCGMAGLAGRLAPTAVPRLSRLLAGGASGEYVGASHRVFSFPQPVKFLALEHALPLGNVPEALTELRGGLRRFGIYSPYPVLVRVGAADDAPLSPAYGRRTGYVNLTVPRALSYVEILRYVEHVLRRFAGRPHWGKAHSATAEILRPRYPEWERFRRMRATMDPTGLFANDYVDRVLGPVWPLQDRPGRPAAAAARGV